MEPLNPRKVIAAAAIVALATSLLTTIAVLGVSTGIRPREVIEHIAKNIPATLPTTRTEREISERVLRQDELVVSVVKRASPAVVSIVATKDVPVVEQYYIDPFGSDPFFRQFFGGGGLQIPQFREKGTRRQQVSSGTGFVISPTGLILTNRHVVADTGAQYTVFFNDQTKVPARVLARDPVQDLAVLMVDRSNLATLALGDSSELAIGQTVIAIGNALGEFQNTVSVGVVSGLHRNIVASGEQLGELIQTDAAINPGNSGGPLLDLRGNVIGINTAEAQGAENIGFAIPINSAKRDIESVTSTGRIVYPFLGVRYQMITKDVQVAQKLPVDSGALVVGDQDTPAVVPGSPADRAGIRSGDIIVEFNAARIDAAHPLSELIQNRRVGDTITLKVLRGSQTLTLQATLEERK